MTDHYFIPVGQAVRRARRARDLRQIELSTLLGWNQSVLSRFENGDKELSFREFVQLIDVLGTEALHGTHELEQILMIANGGNESRAQTLQGAVLDAIVGLEDMQKKLSDKLSVDSPGNAPDPLLDPRNRA